MKRFALLLAVLVVDALPARAQVRPDLPWRTLTTDHFRIHFTPGLEPLARRTAANAEWAWHRLAEELPPPRGTVDIVVADNADYANGYATPYPSNRIVVYARPPVDDMSLRAHADWNLTVVTHELAHIFHLDRAGGWWRAAQRVFGRASPLFPHTYAPNWLVEGLAVHYETKYTTGGRLAGTEFAAYARAFALDDALPPLDAVHIGTPFFPGGSAVYLFGSYLVEAGLTHGVGAGDTDVDAARRLLTRMGGRIVPFTHDANARAALGATFTGLYAAWRDSVRRAAVAESWPDDAEGVEVLVSPRWTVRYPRFLPSGEVLFVADDRRRVPGLYRVDDDRHVRRVGRRNSVDANASIDGAFTVQAEFDYVDPYTIYSDLYEGQGLRRRRLTFAGRLAHPDIDAASGRIVAVQTLPGTTQLVTLTRDDPYVRPLAGGTLDRTWSEPRWSRDGTRIAAVLWERGGRTSVVVLDADGRELRRFSPRGAALTSVSSPAWVPGDTAIVFASDHEGRTMLYLGDVRTGAYGRVWATRTALNTPDVSADGTRLVAVELTSEGYRVVARAMPSAPTLALPAADVTSQSPPFAEKAASDTGARARAYAPGQTLGARWWLPTSEPTDEGRMTFGLLTGGEDVIGRHSWRGTLLLEPQNLEFSGSARYTYAGFGNPTVTLGADVALAHTGIYNTADVRLGTLTARLTQLQAVATAVRPRARLSSFVRVGGAVEVEQYWTDPPALLGLLSNPYYRSTHTYLRPLAGVGVSTLRRPGLSVSTEDGVSLDATYRGRASASGYAGVSHELVLLGSAAKSIPFPGFARQVLAVRAAYGVIADDSVGAFGVGGVSGGSIEVVPGYVVGGSRRDFFVRGFEGGAQTGVRAAAASVEYRAPLARVGRGIGFLPTFLQKTSLIGFADAGAAWCEGAVAGSFVCQASAPRREMVSVGGEFVLDAALSRESLYRFRVGLAHPVRGMAFAARATTFYFTIGDTF